MRLAIRNPRLEIESNNPALFWRAFKDASDLVERMEAERLENSRLRSRVAALARDNSSLRRRLRKVQR